MRSIAGTVSLVLGCSICYTQTIIDAFEAGNLDNWTVVQGNAETVGSPTFGGSFAARLFNPDNIDAQSLALHNTFSDNWGIYEMQCYADGTGSDVQFLLQYLDGNNYYAIACNPLGTHDPELHLYKVVNGTAQTLAMIDPTFGLNVWFSLRVERFCDGVIRIYIDDQLQIELVDNDLRQPGTVAMGAWAESSYFDDITFTSVRDPQFTMLQEDICSGTFYQVGSSRYNRTGTYYDTLTALSGCDSIVQLELTVRPHFLVTEFDTICADDFYVFGSDSLNSTGRFIRSLQSIHGCDSIVELNLSVLGGDTTLEQRMLCAGDFTLFKGDTIRTAGSYYDTIFIEGCSNILQVEVEIGDPDLDLGEDRTHCFNQDSGLVILPQSPAQIMWSDSSVGSQLMVNRPGQYWGVLSLNGCKASDTILIVEECIELGKFYIPNAFTPNGDLINDVFKIEGMSDSSDSSIQIFNRWGSLIFSSENAAQGWDGRIQGENAPPGVYLYVIDVDGEKSAGDVTLLR